jgi:hypothetical protein
MKMLIKKWYIDNRNGDMNIHVPEGSRFFTVRLSTRRSDIFKGYIEDKELKRWFSNIDSNRTVLLNKAGVSSSRQRKIISLLFKNW